jgi:hypothetical protein
VTRVRFERWFLRFSSAALAGAVVALAPRPAAALDEFPQALAKTLGMACTPTCLPCHTAVPGSKQNRRNDGLAAALLRQDDDGRVVDAAELKQHLEAMLAGTLMRPGDSNGDGKDDLENLKDSENPYDGTSLCGSPTYGCGASVAPRAPSRHGALAFTAVVALALVVASRRCRTSSSKT